MIWERSPALSFALAGTPFALAILFRAGLEADPVTHVLLQLPLLGWSGWLVARWAGIGAVTLRPAAANALSLAAVFTILFWMLPRYIDASLTDWPAALAKFISIPMLAGATLAIAWHRTHPFLRGFLKANAISMLVVLAYLYTHAPVRICNSYLVVDQERLGLGFLGAALMLSVAWSLPLFLGPADRPAATEDQGVFPIK